MMISRTLSYVACARTNASGFRNLFITTIWLLVSVSFSTAQTPIQQQKDEALASVPGKQSIVRGRVVYEDTRRPLRRVEVTIYDPAAKGAARNLMTWTDGRGEFQIKNVPAGKYFVAVSAPGIIPSGPFNSEEQQRELISVTVDGTSKSEVIVRVKRGGAISGRVTYADGDPAINASIRVFGRKESKWAPVYIYGLYGDGILTDERGIYRVSGLSPGEYLVGAAEERKGIELSAQDSREGTLLNRARLTTTYYGDVTSLATATVVNVKAGSEETDIHITLADRPVHSISGLVTLKGDSRPIARARLSLKKTDEVASDLEDPVTNTDEQGRFTFEEVEDGSYVLTITPPQSMSRYVEVSTASPTATTQSFVGKRLEVNMAGADLADLMIEVSSGGRISGAIAVEGGKPRPSYVLVWAEAAEAKQVQPSRPVRVQTDGTFALDGLPSGAMFLRTSVPPDDNYYTKSVTVGKTNLLRGPVVLQEGEDITNVRIVISPEVALLSGRVLAANGKSPLPGVSVLLISADPEQQGTMSSRIYGLTNPDGSFRVTGPPGEYLMIVVRPGYYQLSNQALRSRNPNAQRIVLQPGENSKVDIVIPGDK